MRRSGSSQPEEREHGLTKPQAERDKKHEPNLILWIPSHPEKKLGYFRNEAQKFAGPGPFVPPERCRSSVEAQQTPSASPDIPKRPSVRRGMGPRGSPKPCSESLLAADAPCPFGAPHATPAPSSHPWVRFPPRPTHPMAQKKLPGTDLSTTAHESASFLSASLVPRNGQNSKSLIF